MDAARLVEQRKAGKITQEEFFIQLNELRRANSTRGSRDVNEDLSTSDTESVVVGPADSPKGKGSGRKVTTDNNAAVYSATSGVEDREGTSSGTDIGPIEEELRLSMEYNELRQQEQATNPSDRHSVTLESRAEGGAVESTTQQFNYLNGDRELLFFQGGLSESRNSLRGVGPTGFPMCVPAPTGGSLSPPASGGRLESRSQTDTNRGDDSYWLISPRGETETPRRVRKTFASRSGTTRCSTTGEFTETKKARSPGLSPPRLSRTVENNITAPRHWLPVDGGSPRVRDDGTSRFQQPFTVRAPSFTSSNEKKKSISWQETENNVPLHSQPGRRGRPTLGPSSGASPLEETKRRLLTSNRRVCVNSDSAHWRYVDRASSHQSTAQSPRPPPPTPQPVFLHRVDRSESVRSLSYGAHCRERCRHPEKPVSYSTDRRVSGSASAGSLEFGGAERYPARRDRYGYPLHEKGGLGTSGDNNKSSYFAPMVKGLPEFYQSRPRRTVDSLGQNVDSGRGGAAASQSASLYERTTGWLAKAGDVRQDVVALTNL